MRWPKGVEATSRRTTLALGFALLLLAGCSSAGSSGGPGPAAGPAEAKAAEELHLVATPTTGIVRGVVVDEGIRPLGGAAVVVLDSRAARSTNTTASGAFGFDGLAPGAYLVKVHKAGYLDQQVSAPVVAGQAEPPFVKVQLKANGSYMSPYEEVRKLAGFIECTSNPVAVCGIPNNYRPTACGTHPALCYGNVSSDHALFQFSITGNTSFLQAELFWKPTSDLNKVLSWNHVAGMGCSGVEGRNNVTHGTAPLIAPMVQPEIRVPGGKPCSLFLAATAGPPDEAFCLPVQVPLFNTLCPGFAFEQDFTIFVHAFYGYVPPPGWRFSVDGDAPPPR
ncbi:MAG TPA: carboxypeptidase-like regulatory domain-containing protein [Candidatus Thermoplasmatota archaeon]|nr:carboxypeptidase-like regulatory domain-containing protein [Candidatus Thermoplasmatota archaeon]